MVLAVAACATSPQIPTPEGTPAPQGCTDELVNPLDGGSIAGGGGGDVGLVIAAAGILIFSAADVFIYGSCEIAALRHPVTAVAPADGIFRAADGSFSVAVPQAPDDKSAMDVRQAVGDGDMLVTFQSKDVGAQPVYVVSLSPSQHRSVVGNGDLAQQGIRSIGSQDVTLDDRAARFEVFVRTPGNLPDDERISQKTIYYLVYSMDVAGKIVVVSISWPDDCRGCSSGDEREIRKLNPLLDRFVGSFHMPAQPPTA